MDINELKEAVHFIGELGVVDDSVVGYLEVWIETDDLRNYFGGTDEVSASVCYQKSSRDTFLFIENENGDTTSKELSDEEELFFRELILEYCKRRYGCHIDELYQDYIH